MSNLVTAKILLEHINLYEKHPNFKCPETCIICFGSDWLATLKEIFTPLKKGPLNVSICKIDGREIGIYKCLLGTPAASISLEELIEMGFKRFIAVGSCGSLTHDLSLGEIVVGKSAYIDEGCSKHYLSDKDTIENINSPLYKNWTEKYPNIKAVTAWTTDAPYMETKEKYEYFIGKKASIVEMEMSCLLAVADYKNVDMLNLFVISDHLSPDKWEPGFKNKEYESGRDQLAALIKEFVNTCI